MSTFYNPTPTNFYDDYIAHHGILGMKWGKQNGPPYPLGSGDHSKSEKSAGWKKSLGGGRNEEMYDRKKKTSSSTSTNKKPDRHERAANASAKDAADLRKHLYTKEADAVQKVSDQQMAKSKTANNQDDIKFLENGFKTADKFSRQDKKRYHKIIKDTCKNDKELYNLSKKAYKYRDVDSINKYSKALDDKSKTYLGKSANVKTYDGIPLYKHLSNGMDSYYYNEYEKKRAAKRLAVNVASNFI